MPELPDVVVYAEALQRCVGGATLGGIRLVSSFVLRSVETPPQDLVGRKLKGVERLGKRLVLAFTGNYFVVLHLMIAGRLQWGPRRDTLAARMVLVSFDFDRGSLIFTEASKKRRAALHVVHGRAALQEFSRGGLEVLESDAKTFTAALQRENHTLKRALTDPRLFSGIGNAYSDEILHKARMSPVRLTQRLSSAECGDLFRATVATLNGWTERLRQEVGDGFPKKVTAFRPEMAVHGRYRLPCPECGHPVQRIVYAENETNYCAVCQNAGKLLADRALSRLLKNDWPRNVDEIENLPGRLLKSVEAD